jgi:hypothetical protein
MGSILAFLGGNAFRHIFGEFAAYMSKRQDHEMELERMRAQGDLEREAHERNLESIRVQADLGVKTIRVQADADIDRADVDAWAKAVADVGKTTGNTFIDVWNGSIRPALATLAMLAVALEIAFAGFTLSGWDHELIGAILGIYVADRSLSRRGK